MSLLVLDPDIASAQSLGYQLCEQLTELGFDILTISDSAAALGLTRQGNVELLACCSESDLSSLNELPAGVALVWYTGVQPSTDAVLAAIRLGCGDIWTPDAPIETLAFELLARNKRFLDEVDLEVSGMRAELERDQRAGQHIQMGMLPPNPMGIGHYKLQHRVVPSLLLSGDFVDYFQISERYFACYVADVAGHGASSAFVTVLLKNFSRRLRREYKTSMLSNPGEILAWINAELIDHGIDKHVAMFFGIFDTQTQQLRYANAAHFPPALVVVDGSAQSLEQKAKPLGLFPEIAYASESVSFPPGARLVVFSDGVLDLLDSDTVQNKEQYLQDSICSAQTMDELWSHLREENVGSDDVSCLLVEFAES